MRINYDHLAALAAIVREGNFERAARALHVTASAISQRLRQLEDSAGQVLVVRGTPCRATAAGESLYRHALQVALLEQDLGSSESGTLGAHPSSVTLSLAVNADSLATWLIPALARFADDTGLRVDVVLDDQDHTAQWLRSGRVLGAVTADAKPVQGCRVEPLGAMRYRATASPAYRRRWFAKGVTSAALRQAPAIIYGPKDDLENRFVRQVLGHRGVALTTHTIPSSTAFVDASLSGLGWGMNPEMLIADHLRRGRLVDLVSGKSLDIPLFWQQWQLTSTALASLAAALKAQASLALRNTGT